MGNKYVETREPYIGWIIYDDGDQKISMYNPEFKIKRNISRPRFVYDISHGKYTTADDGEIIFRDGNRNNLDPDNLIMEKRGHYGLIEGLFPFDDKLVQYHCGTKNGKPIVKLYTKDGKFDGYIAEERYWLSVKERKIITKFDGKVGHLDGDIFNNGLENVYLIPGAMSMGEGIYSEYKIETQYNKTRNAYMIYLHERDISTNKWVKVRGMSRARYIVQKTLGYELDKSVSVEHIGTVDNDDIDNLCIIDAGIRYSASEYISTHSKNTSTECFTSNDYVVPIQAPIIVTQFELCNTLGIPIYPITSPSSDETLNKEYVFNSISRTPFDI